LLILNHKEHKEHKDTELFYPQMTRIYTDNGTRVDWYLCKSV